MSFVCGKPRVCHDKFWKYVQRSSYKFLTSSSHSIVTLVLFFKTTLDSAFRLIFFRHFLYFFSFHFAIRLHFIRYGSSCIRLCNQKSFILLHSFCNVIFVFLNPSMDANSFIVFTIYFHFSFTFSNIQH